MTRTTGVGRVITAVVGKGTVSLTQVMFIMVVVVLNALKEHIAGQRVMDIGSTTTTVERGKADTLADTMEAVKKATALVCLATPRKLQGVIMHILLVHAAAIRAAWVTAEAAWILNSMSTITIMSTMTGSRQALDLHTVR